MPQAYIRYDVLNEDAGENMFFGRQLEAFKSKLYNTKYPQLLIRSLLPVSYDNGGPGSKLITYRSYTLTGQFQAISNYASDSSRSDAFGQEFTSKVKDYGGSWEWSIREVQASAQAAAAGLGPTMALETGKAMANRRAAEVNLENIGLQGDTELGLIGLNNIPSANAYAPPNGVNSGTSAWGGKTPDEMLADLFAMETTPINNTNQVEFATVLLMPTDKYNLAANTRVSIASDTTVLEQFLRTSQWIKTVIPWSRLAGIGAGATLNTSTGQLAGGLDRMISYRPDADTITLEITEEYNTLPPEVRNYSFVVNALMGIGGVICEFPLSVTYADFIAG